MCISADRTLAILQCLGRSFAVPVTLANVRELLATPLLCKIPLALFPPEFHEYFCDLSSGVELQLSPLFALALGQRVEKKKASESSYHQLWDDLIARPLEILAAHCGLNLDCDRDVAEAASTVKLKRPDVLVRMNGVLILKGEEKNEPDKFSLAVQELKDKMKVWNAMYFGSLEFIFTYAAAGATLQFFILTPTRKLVAVSPSLNLTLPSHRLQTLLLVVNMFRTLPGLGDKLPPAGGPRLFSRMVRDSGVVLHFNEDHVLKRIPHAALVHGVTVSQLKEVYGLVNSLPHAVHCEPGIKDCKGRITLQLSPIGLECVPSTQEELRRAIKAVLSCMAALHAQGWVHRDVRWPNVLRDSSGAYFIIDFDLAVKGPSAFVPSVLDWCPPEVERGMPFTAAGDVYQIGQLMAGAEVEELDAAGVDLQQQLCDPLPRARASAVKALQHAWLRTPYSYSSYSSSSSSASSPKLKKHRH